ncbi:hypothetical protein [Curtobacterium sp. BRB10]|uniref:hypothetical protein n=1 Tax=Curtobacterium sp. BRB10 TaxID=2962579 RepID=UPI0028818D5A|nr:hypothetical protein [Curtobacterium sp. BRB10]MDT0235261.1 hypothetical protein [Curtobacterium sp. BRB10]
MTRHEELARELCGRWGNPRRNEIFELASLYPEVARRFLAVISPWDEPGNPPARFDDHDMPLRYYEAAADIDVTEGYGQECQELVGRLTP